MDSNSEFSNSGGADNELPSDEEFAKWLKAEPKNFEEWSRIVERIARGEYQGLTPESRAAAQKAVAQCREVRGIEVVKAKMAAIMQVMQRPAGSMLAEERLAQCNALLDELIDALLETPEPHRTTLLKQVLPVREEIRALKLPD